MEIFKFNDAPGTIAIFRALQLGDMLCTVPAFRALRAAFPKTHITLVGLPWAKGFVQRFSHYLDDFVEFPGWPGLPEREYASQNIPGFLQEMQGRHFDLALQMQGSGVITNPLIALFGAKQMAGYYMPGNFLPDEKSFLAYPEGEHEVHIFLRLMQFLGASEVSDQMEFPINAQERLAFEQLCIRAGIELGGYICLHPGARFVGRRWPAEKFALVGDHLQKKGYQVILTGTKEERPLTQAVNQNMRQPALDLSGQTDLGVLANLLAGARLLVSNDTGVSHLAAALQVPSVILFSASDPNRWRPLNHQLHHVIENSNQASPQVVLAEIEALLQEEDRHVRESLK
jgi:ADP-heptose:LPS heptosyltransferase